VTSVNATDHTPLFYIVLMTTVGIQCWNTIVLETVKCLFYRPSYCSLY